MNEDNIHSGFIGAVTGVIVAIVLMSIFHKEPTVEKEQFIRYAGDTTFIITRDTIILQNTKWGRFYYEERSNDPFHIFNPNKNKLKHESK